VAVASTLHLPCVRIPSPAPQSSIHMTLPRSAGTFPSLVARAHVSVSVSVTVALLVAVSVSAIVTYLDCSTASCSSSTTAISLWCPPCCTTPLCLGPSTTLFEPVAVSLFPAELSDALPVSPIFLLCYAASAASVFFSHLLLNAI